MSLLRKLSFATELAIARIAGKSDRFLRDSGLQRVLRLDFYVQLLRDARPLVISQVRFSEIE